jgi:hypothetical protein
MMSDMASHALARVNALHSKIIARVLDRRGAQYMAFGGGACRAGLLLGECLEGHTVPFGVVNRLLTKRRSATSSIRSIATPGRRTPCCSRRRDRRRWARNAFKAGSASAKTT